MWAWGCLQGCGVVGLLWSAEETGEVQGGHGAAACGQGAGGTRLRRLVTGSEYTVVGFAALARPPTPTPTGRLACLSASSVSRAMPPLHPNGPCPSTLGP